MIVMSWRPKFSDCNFQGKEEEVPLDSPLEHLGADWSSSPVGDLSLLR